jgi:hypothetical protein
MQVPAFLLRRLYVKGSLRHENSALVFDLHNALGSGYADRVLPLRIDGEEVTPGSCAFVVEGQPVPFESISETQPMTLAMGRTLSVRAEGLRLEPGQHSIELGFIVTGMGEMRFDVEDSISDA